MPLRVSVIGAGVAGLCCALELAERGATVEVFERTAALGIGSCSWFAGGMLAPWCEEELAGKLIRRLGEESLPWWERRCPSTLCNGTLVIAHERDAAELRQFAKRTQAHEWLDGERLAVLEPELAPRFRHGLYFPAEGHLDPRAALNALAERLKELHVPLHFGAQAPSRTAGRVRVDCRGLAAREDWPQLRGVKGEMLLLRVPEFRLQRPVRVLHPRLPLYVVPRAAGLLMVGATMLESDSQGPISARSMLELLSAAYALHPVFGEAQIIECGSGVRPALPDNLPRLRRSGDTVYVNGLYRHGFLVAPALARRVAQYLLEGQQFPEVMDEDRGERRLA